MQRLVNPNRPRQQRLASRGRRSGFTLLEVLIVVMIIGVIAAMVVPNLLGQQRQAMVDRTKTNIKSAEGALELYAKDHYGRYPEAKGKEVWSKLMQSEEVNGRKREPYLTQPPKDAWDQVLQYEYPTSKRNLGPAVWSDGETSESTDDITNYEAENQET